MDSLSIESVLNQTYKNSQAQKSDGNVDSQEEFLLLLVTQLKNQDPLNPLEAQEFAVQLAQFSQVERLMNIESTLEKSAESNDLMTQATNKSLAAVLIGKTVRTTGNSFEHFEEGGNILEFKLAEGASTVNAVIKNASGTVVRQLDFGEMEGGDHTFVWDGKNNDENNVSSGSYTFEVLAKDNADKTIGVSYYQIGIVEGVRYEDGKTPWIIVNGKETPLSDVSEIRQDISELLGS